MIIDTIFEGLRNIITIGCSIQINGLTCILSSKLTPNHKPSKLETGFKTHNIIM